MFSVDPTLYSTILNSFFGLLTVVVTGIMTMQSANKKRLQQQLAIAQSDIVFLLQVEAHHCAKHVEHTHASFKLRVRQDVTKKGFVWSGRFTPGRARSDAGYLPPKVSLRIRMKLLIARIFANNRGIPMSTNHHSVYSLISTSA